jgi:D-glycero-alpha-D-manno-heptose 1-phosphate guanylyltransferase
MEAIILAGGLGTRLRSEIAELPKCLAPVNGKVFIDILIEYLERQGINKFIFSLGYKSELVIEHLDNNFSYLDKLYVVEEEPLGTGGAIKKAIEETTEDNVLIINGDTYFDIDSRALFDLHLSKKAACTIALKEMEDTERYGTVELNEEDRIIAFKEKQFNKKGFINGGVYVLNVAAFLQKALPEKFSFEKEYLEAAITEQHLFGKPFDAYFIDIGIPSAYRQFEKDHLQRVMPIDKTWTLFLDRDGVINHEKHKDYIHTWDEFVFYDGALKALKIFAQHFNRIIVVTNQKGIGKGVTLLEDLQLIHTNMVKAIELAGGRVDAVYFSPHLEDDHPDRKPNHGMGLQAVNDFPDIDLTKSIMVGNTLSDMQFGRNLGVAKNIFLTTTRPEVDITDNRIDAVYNSLLEFAVTL